MSKAFWSHFKHFGRLRRKKLVCSGSVSHSQQTWWKSSQPARCKTRHTGKFSSKPMSRHYWQVGCGQTAIFSPSVRGRGVGGEGEKGIWQIPHTSYSKHPIPLDTLNLLFPSNTFLPRTYYFFQISQPANICLKNRYFSFSDLPSNIHARF